MQSSERQLSEGELTIYWLKTLKESRKKTEVFKRMLGMAISKAPGRLMSSNIQVIFMSKCSWAISENIFHRWWVDAT